MEIDISIAGCGGLLISLDENYLLTCTKWFRVLLARIPKLKEYWHWIWNHNQCITARPKCWHFANGFFKRIWLMIYFMLWFKFHWRIYLAVPLTIGHQWPSSMSTYGVATTQWVSTTLLHKGCPRIKSSLKYEFKSIFDFFFVEPAWYVIIVFDCFTS